VCEAPLHRTKAKPSSLTQIHRILAQFAFVYELKNMAKFCSIFLAMDHLFCDCPDEGQDRLGKIVDLCGKNPEKVFNIINRVLSSCERCSDLYSRYWKPVDFEIRRKLEKLKNKKGGESWEILYDKSTLDAFIHDYDEIGASYGFEGMFLVVFGHNSPDLYQIDIDGNVGEREALFFINEKIPKNGRFVDAFKIYLGIPDSPVLPEYHSLVSELYHKFITFANGYHGCKKAGSGGDYRDALNSDESSEVICLIDESSSEHAGASGITDHDIGNEAVRSKKETVLKIVECVFLLFKKSNEAPDESANNEALLAILKDAVKFTAFHSLFWKNIRMVHKLGLIMGLCTYTVAHTISSAILFLFNIQDFHSLKDFANINGMLQSAFDLHAVLESLAGVEFFSSDLDSIPDEKLSYVLLIINSHLDKYIRIKNTEELKILKIGFCLITKKIVLSQLEMLRDTNRAVLGDDSPRWPDNIKGAHYLYYLEIFAGIALKTTMPTSKLERMLHNGIIMGEDVMALTEHIDIVMIARDLALIQKLGFSILKPVEKLLTRCILKCKGVLYLCTHIQEVSEIAYEYRSKYVRDSYYFHLERIFAKLGIYQSRADGRGKALAETRNNAQNASPAGENRDEAIRSRFRPVKVVLSPKNPARIRPLEMRPLGQLPSTEKKRPDAAPALAQLSILSNGSESGEKAEKKKTEYHKSVIVVDNAPPRNMNKAKMLEAPFLRGKLALKSKLAVEAAQDHITSFAHEFLQAIDAKTKLARERPITEMPSSFSSYALYYMFLKKVNRMEMYSNALANIPPEISECKCRIEFFTELTLQLVVHSPAVGRQDLVLLSPLPLNTHSIAKRTFCASSAEGARYGIVKSIKARSPLGNPGPMAYDVSVIVQNCNGIGINGCLYCYALGNLISIYREYVALEQVRVSEFLPLLLNEKKIGLHCTANALLMGRYRMGLNPVQEKAILKCVYSTNKFLLVQGPPGTGKTKTIVGLVIEMRLLHPKKRILISAPSNAAIDEIGMRLLDESFFKGAAIVRLGTTDNPRLKHLSIEHFEKISKMSKKAIIGESSIVLSTLNTSGSEYSNMTGYSYLIIDEACQATEITTLIPLKNSFEKVILVGDPRQLPPTVFSENYALETSLFERLSKNHEVLLLDTQYRMDPQISQISSDIFYRGMVKSASKLFLHEGTRHSFKPYYFVNMNGGEEQQDANKSHYNAFESGIALKIFWKIQRKYPSLVVGILSPYKAQVSLMRRGAGLLLQNQIETVDGFQGREADVIIVSTVRRERLGFLDDPRRINVAITRPKKCLILVGSSDCLYRSVYWREIIFRCPVNNVWDMGSFKEFLDQL